MLNWENNCRKSFQDEGCQSKWRRKDLESGLTLSKDSLNWEGVWDKREWQREFEYIKNTLYLNDQTKCILRTTWPRTPPPRNFHSEAQDIVSVK